MAVASRDKIVDDHRPPHRPQFNSETHHTMADASTDQGGDGASDSKNYSRTPTSWDQLDDILLMHLKDQQKLGWKEIASNFHNRTPNACQFRWRRLKLGNLKNPPKLASPGHNPPSAPAGSSVKRQRKNKDDFSAASPFSPVALATFTGYDNNITSALAGLNALSHTASPMPPAFESTSSDFEPVTARIEPNLDPQLSQGGSSNGGGYYAEILVDPTMNLPHNQPGHPPALTPRNSTSQQGHHSRSNSTLAVPVHNNSIIQIIKDDRNSVLSSRSLVLSLPSKSMTFPHHRLNSLAHMPVLFGGTSVSGPSRNPSVSAPTTVPSLRNGSVSGGSGYFSRSGSVVIPHATDEKEKKKKTPKKDASDPKSTPKKSKSSKSMLHIPWLIEEDELLVNRRNRELSFAELLILLPQRTEGEIWTRIDYLERLRNGLRSSPRTAGRRRQSSIGLDDVDDFYAGVEDVIETDSDDDVLVDVDTIERAKRKRRTSSSVNPLTMK